MQLNKDYESEINLKDLLFHVLYRWRSILLIALLCALAACGYNVIRHQTANSGNATSVEEAQTEAAKAEKREEDQKTYKKESIYINLDPQIVWKASSIYVVNAGSDSVDNAGADLADGILRLYSFPLSEATEDELMEAFGTNKQAYVSELVTVFTDTLDNSIQVDVIGASEESVKSGMNLIKRRIEQINNEINAENPHTLTMAGENIVCSADQDLATRQTDLSKAMEQSKKDVEQARNNLGAALEDGGKHLSAKSLLKWGLIGFFAGAFIMGMAYMAAYVLSGKLRNADELSEQYNLPVLGEFRKSSSIHREKGLDKFLSKWELGKNREKEETVYNNIAALIAGNPDAKNILLVSTLPENTIVPVREAISSRLEGKTVEIKASFLQNSEAIPAAARADAAILIEEKDISLNRDIERMAETLMISGSKVIGSIIL